MRAGVWNIVMGAVAIAAGASGKFVFVGTDSGLLLMLIGAAIFVWGAIQFARERKSKQ